LTPDQVAILPVSEKYNDYSKKLSNLLKNYDLRALVDDRNEKVGKKIRDTEVKKVPYMLIVGEKEVESGMLSVRKQGEGDIGTFSVEDFAKIIEKDIEADLQLS
jgi:threonyl-tRNA synthetase